MKKRFTLASGCLLIAICLMSCVSNGKLTTSQNKPDSQTNISGRMKKPMPSSLLNFEDDNNGNVYVSVEGKMLFKPGSAMVNAKVRKELLPLGEMLYHADENFSIMVKGISDTVAVPRAKYANAWSLSQARANSIMLILLESALEIAAAEQKVSMNKSAKAKKEAMDANSIPEEQPAKAEADNKKYILVLLDSL